MSWIGISFRRVNVCLVKHVLPRVVDCLPLSRREQKLLDELGDSVQCEHPLDVKLAIEALLSDLELLVALDSFAPACKLPLAASTYATTAALQESDEQECPVAEPEFLPILNSGLEH